LAGGQHVDGVIGAFGALEKLTVSERVRGRGTGRNKASSPSPFRSGIIRTGSDVRVI
jgi:hypothetical protein